MAGFSLAFGVLVAVVIVACAGAAPVPLAGRRLAWAVLGAAVVTALGAFLPAPDWVVGPLAGAGLICLGAWGGAAIGRAVEHARYLWPLVLVATGADLWSVTAPQGISHQMVDGQAPALLPLLVLAVPVPGVGVAAVLGVGDIAFTGLLLGMAHRHGLPRRRVVWGLAVGFGLCLLLLLTLALPLPALPFIGPAVGVALGRSTRPRGSELWLAAAVVGALFGWRLWAG